MNQMDMILYEKVKDIMYGCTISFNDMRNLEHVYIIKNTDINELRALNISYE